LTPCILELGGKSPVLIDKSVRDVRLAARRVVWGKFVNVGEGGREGGKEGGREGERGPCQECTEVIRTPF
jgi:hypothetical protein